MASFVNIRLVWKWLAKKNTLPYIITALITTVKIFIVQATDPLRYISKDFLVSVEKSILLSVWKLLNLFCPYRAKCYKTFVVVIYQCS